MGAGVATAVDHYAALAATAVFAGLPPDSLRRLADACQVVQAEKGVVLFWQEDAAHSVYLVLAGRIVILLSSPHGRELVLSEMREGDLFGENALICGAPRSATAVAREDTRLLRVEGSAFLAALEHDSLLALRLLQLAAARLAASNDRESALVFLAAGARIAHVLLELDRQDATTADHGYVTISQEEIAQRTGLTRQTVARFLGKWRRDGWLLTGRGRIVLLNRAALQEVQEANLV